MVPFYISPKATEYRKHNKQWPSGRPDSIEELVAKADPYILLVAKSAGITVIVGLVLVMTGRAIAPMPFESGRRPSPPLPSTRMALLALAALADPSPKPARHKLSSTEESNEQ